MSSFSPAPQCFVDCIIDLREYFLTAYVPVIVRPSPDDRVKDRYQMPGCSSFIRSDDFPYFPQEGFDILPSRRNEQFAGVLADILSEKIETFLDVHDSGLFR